MRPVVVIEPIRVPSQYQESGFTSSAMSQRIADAIEIIQRDAQTSVQKVQLVQLSEPDEDGGLRSAGD